MRTKVRNPFGMKTIMRCFDLAVIEKWGTKPQHFNERRFYIIVKAFAKMRMEILKIKQKENGSVGPIDRKYLLSLSRQFWIECGANTKKPIRNVRGSTNYYRNIVDLLVQKGVIRVYKKGKADFSQIYRRRSNEKELKYKERRYLNSYKTFNILLNTNRQVRDMVEQDIPPYNNYPTIYEILEPILVTNKIDSNIMESLDDNSGYLYQHAEDALLHLRLVAYSPLLSFEKNKLRITTAYMGKVLRKKAKVANAIAENDKCQIATLNSSHPLRIELSRARNERNAQNETENVY